MLWAVGARYGYDTLKMKVHRLAFYYRGHVFMSNEERTSALVGGES